MFTGISFLMAAITALVRGFRQTRQALAIAAAEECTLEEAARVGNSDRLIAIRGQVHPWPIPNPFTKPQPQTPVHPACHLLRACPYAHSCLIRLLSPIAQAAARWQAFLLRWVERRSSLATLLQVAGHPVRPRQPPRLRGRVQAASLLARRRRRRRAVRPMSGFAATVSPTGFEFQINLVWDLIKLVTFALNYNESPYNLTHGTSQCRTHRPQKLICLISLCTNPVSILSVPIQTVR
jgi:hypothetical protein